MTWIVGTPTLFGYAILVSDIQVTFASNDKTQYFDCLQKIYPVSKSILGGFAGSVRIGFRLLEFIRRSSQGAPENMDWSLDVIANTWLPRCFRRIFRFSEPEEKALGSRILLAGAHPWRNNGPWPHTSVYRFASPNFEPTRANYRQVLAIGSPDGRYMAGITHLVSDFVFMHASVGGEFGPSSMLAHYLMSEVEEAPFPGVSAVFQVGIANRGRVAIDNFIEEKFTADGQKKDRPGFPRIASTYGEFIQFCESAGLAAGTSLC